MKLLQKYKIYKILCTNVASVTSGHYYTSTIYETDVNGIHVMSEKRYPDYHYEGHATYTLQLKKEDNQILRTSGIFAKLVHNLLKKQRYGVNGNNR